MPLQPAGGPPGGCPGQWRSLRVAGHLLVQLAQQCRPGQRTAHALGGLRPALRRRSEVDLRVPSQHSPRAQPRAGTRPRPVTVEANQGSGGHRLSIATRMSRSATRTARRGSRTLLAVELASRLPGLGQQACFVCHSDPVRHRWIPEMAENARGNPAFDEGTATR